MRVILIRLSIISKFLHTKVTFIIFYIVVFSVNLFGQTTEDRPVLLKKHGENLQAAFEELHQLNYKNNLDSFSSDYKVNVSFNISTRGDVINIQYSDLTFSKNITQYTNNLLLSSNGLWYPELKNCQPIISKSINCLFLLSSKKISQIERLEKLEEMNEDILSGNKELSSLFDINQKDAVKFIITIKY